MEDRTLKKVMPKEFGNGVYPKTRAYKMRDVPVTREHCRMWEQDEYEPWPGQHKNVHLWVELENGYAVGWNENLSRGWSFPVYKL